MKHRKQYFDNWLNGQLKDPSFRKTYKQEDVRARLALRIAEIRKKEGMSQSQLAKKLHTTQQTISDIETFKHANVTLTTLQSIAEALNRRLVVDLK